MILGQLPGDWGFFGAYLTGGISIAVLAIGSINPGILAFIIDRFSQVYPDYRERVLAHEAAHFLVGSAMARSAREWAHAHRACRARHSQPAAAAPLTRHAPSFCRVSQS